MSNLLFGNIVKQLTKKDKILQIGCGTGNLAKLLIYSAYSFVRGVDVSERVIDVAKHSVHTRHRKRFISSKFDESHVYDIEYDTVICAEVFEYSDCDISVLNEIEKGTKIIFTVPGFYNEVFSRWFSDEKEIKERYKDLVEIKDIKEVIINNDCCKTYLVNCIKK